jgi:hypothetical protein
MEGPVLQREIAETRPGAAQLGRAPGAFGVRPTGLPARVGKLPTPPGHAGARPPPPAGDERLSRSSVAPPWGSDECLPEPW